MLEDALPIPKTGWVSMHLLRVLRVLRAFVVNTASLLSTNFNRTRAQFRNVWIIAGRAWPV